RACETRTWPYINRSRRGGRATSRSRQRGRAANDEWPESAAPAEQRLPPALSDQISRGHHHCARRGDGVRCCEPIPLRRGTREETHGERAKAVEPGSQKAEIGQAEGRGLCVQAVA